MGEITFFGTYYGAGDIGDADNGPDDNSTVTQDDGQDAEAAPPDVQQAPVTPPIHPKFAHLTQSSDRPAPEASQSEEAPVPERTGSQMFAAEQPEGREQDTKTSGDQGPAAPQQPADSGSNVQVVDNFQVTNATPQDAAKLKLALQYLRQSPTASGIIDAAQKPKKVPAIPVIPGLSDGTNLLTICIVHDGDDTYDRDTHTLYWDPDASMVDENTGNGYSPTGVQSAALMLLHEMAHSTDKNSHLYQDRKNTQYGKNGEQYAVGLEDQVAKELGEPTRDNHKGEARHEDNPTEHTNPGNQWVADTKDPKDPAKLVEHTYGQYQPGTFPNAPATGYSGKD